ncbi:MAG: type II secretion system F family protein [Intrasporangium sp.]|uniref:type II secretion system F family protein n=1 Tax=Intrasporangium sp. TaxID=1925024 RepID=UPI00264A0BFF|nr:type II secretion system F family protein [Intrasporangium sp.]MDN5797258.1 type II secretion system F family protein [Intrasporangium sp.]
MSALVAALAGALLTAGLLGIAAGTRLTPTSTTGAPSPARARLLAGLSRRYRALSVRTRRLLAAGLAAGVLIALATGWLLAALIVPAAAAGLPYLLSSPESAARVERLEAMEEWTRSLAGILTAGVGLEQALIATLRSTPSQLRAEVARLAARLRARWATEDALRVFADELDDATGDLIAGNLILAARRRGPGVASVLEALAESVAADVRARREIESDRAKPRSTARWVTIITIGVLAFLAVTGQYVAPYGSPFGQVLLSLLLGLYVATLIWMKRMAAGQRLPRFIGAAAKQAAR